MKAAEIACELFGVERKSEPLDPALVELLNKLVEAEEPRRDQLSTRSLPSSFQNSSLIK